MESLLRKIDSITIPTLTAIEYFEEALGIWLGPKPARWSRYLETVSDPDDAHDHIDQVAWYSWQTETVVLRSTETVVNELGNLDGPTGTTSGSHRTIGGPTRFSPFASII